MEKVRENIDIAIMAIASKREHRNYMGASSLGEPCDRKLWYQYKQPKHIDDPRVHRIMDMGHMVESYAIAMLKHAGYEVFHEDEQTQFRFEDEEVAGSMDGVIIIDDEPYLLEIKSANDKRFNEMKKLGVRTSDPIYYTQMQIYMYKFELKKALFFVLNKNNSEIYTEVLDLDAKEAIYAIKRGKQIARSEEEPERKYAHPGFFRCKFCNYKNICWGGSDEGAPIIDEKSAPKIVLGKNFLLGK